MKRFIRSSLAVIVILLVSAMAAQAGHFHGGVWIGPGWGPGWGAPYPYYSYPYPYYAAPPVVIQQPAPEVYVQPAPQPEEPTYWYYCQDSRSYYPYVKQCPSGWMKVVPSPPPSQRKE